MSDTDSDEIPPDFGVNEKNTKMSESDSDDIPPHHKCIRREMNRPGKARLRYKKSPKGEEPHHFGKHEAFIMEKPEKDLDVDYDTFVVELLDGYDEPRKLQEAIEDKNKDFTPLDSTRSDKIRSINLIPMESIAMKYNYAYSKWVKHQAVLKKAVTRLPCIYYHVKEDDVGNIINTGLHQVKKPVKMFDSLDDFFEELPGGMDNYYWRMCEEYDAGCFTEDEELKIARREMRHARGSFSSEDDEEESSEDEDLVESNAAMQHARGSFSSDEGQY